MPTEKLYYQDSFQRTFSATVLSCEKGNRGWDIVLDRTAFYPEGGGQPADYGTLNGSIKISDVQERAGIIYHTADQPLAAGTNVTGSIDWVRRFDLMQQHSGEHILSGILCEQYHCDNVGFHLGADTVTIDYNTPISWEQVLAAEHRANAVIAEDSPVEITWPSATELETLSYRSKKKLDGAVRIVTFPNADCCACCGTHVRSAGQVELVKALSVQPFRDGVRMEIVCGRRALTLFDSIWEQNLRAAQLLSVKPTATAAAVERILAELSAARERAGELESQYFHQIAEQYRGKGTVLLFQPTMRPDSVRRLADAVSRTCHGLAAVFAPAPESGQYFYALVQSNGQDIAGLVRELNTALHGRGGGRNGFAQGRVRAERNAIQLFWTEHTT